MNRLRTLGRYWTRTWDLQYVTQTHTSFLTYPALVGASSTYRLPRWLSTSTEPANIEAVTKPKRKEWSASSTPVWWRKIEQQEIL